MYKVTEDQKESLYHDGFVVLSNIVPEAATVGVALIGTGFSLEVVLTYPAVRLVITGILFN